MFGLLESLPDSVQKKALISKEYAFYKLVFSQIDEDKFSVLYSEVKSRPNSPVNILVVAMILMAYNKWSYEELFNQIEFNILTKLALGLDSIEEHPFSPATIFNFQNRLNAHFCKTGENFNTLKNQGYHLEHNYGHGEKNLSYNFYLLTMLAFYFHQIFELTDKLYKANRANFGSKVHMWGTLRAYIKILVFDTWENLLKFALKPEDYNPSWIPPP